MDISVAANITLARLDATMRHGFIDHGRERSIAEDWIRRLRIKTPERGCRSAGISAAATNRRSSSHDG